MRGKEILVFVIIVLLLFSSTVVTTTTYASKSVEERAKDLLRKGDTINEALSVFTNEEIENSKFLSKLLEKSEEQRKEDLKRYEKMEREENKITERDIASLCGATEDYIAHEKECEKLYRMLEKGIIEDDPDFEYD